MGTVTLSQHAKLSGSPAPKLHQIFRHARLSQFPRIGQKWRIQQERDQRTARACSRFDRGLGVWASRETILHELRVMEARRDPSEQMAWSLATVKRSLQRLEASGVVQRHGIRHEQGHRWGTRVRVLCPGRLLARSECEPLIPAKVSRRYVESEPLEVKGFETSKSKANHHRQNQKTDDDSPDSISKQNVNPQTNTAVDGEPTPKPTPAEAYAIRLAGLVSTARKSILARTSEDPALVDAVLESVIQRAADAGTVIHTARYLEVGFDTFLADEEAEIDAEIESEGEFPSIAKILEEDRRRDEEARGLPVIPQAMESCRECGLEFPALAIARHLADGCPEARRREREQAAARDRAEQGRIAAELEAIRTARIAFEQSPEGIAAAKEQREREEAEAERVRQEQARAAIEAAEREEAAIEGRRKDREELRKVEKELAEHYAKAAIPWIVGGQSAGESGESAETAVASK